MLIQVSLSLNIFDHLTYEFSGDENTLKEGMRVIVPLGNRITTGWVIVPHSDFKNKVKQVIGIIEDTFLPDSNFLKFVESISTTYFVSMGRILDMALSPKKKSLQQIYFNIDDKVERLAKFSLKELQIICKEKPLSFFYKNKCETIFLQKTVHRHTANGLKNRYLLDYERIDRYRKIIQSYRQKGLSVLITVPDNLSADFFKQQLEDCDTYHSRMKINERENLWCNCLSGEIKIIAGGLSATLLPIKNLGCIISERSGSFLYKKASFSEFNITHLARLRAEQFGLPFVEGFSTYTSESFLKRRQVVIEDKRHDKQVEISVRHLPRKEPGIPSLFMEILKANFLANKKILVIINRKSSSRYLFCQKCLKIQKCNSCSGILYATDSGISCSKCDFYLESYDSCSICNTDLVILKDMSISNLKDIIQKELTEKGIKTLTADNLVDMETNLDQLQNTRITIATPVILNPFFKNLFDSIIYFRPESIFSMDEYSTGEMIFSMVSDLKELVKEGGTIDIFSVFHFHYSLKLINKEREFFTRELKYRRWFMLPPFCTVYALEIRAESLRKLAAEMRSIYSMYKKEFNIKRIYLHSRKKIRGKYNGHIEIHTTPQIIKKSELLKKKNIGIKIIAI